MPDIFDLMPASLWPTQPFIPPGDPTQPWPPLARSPIASSPDASD
jgi:hypothetical protein